MQGSGGNGRRRVSSAGLEDKTQRQPSGIDFLVIVSGIKVKLAVGDDERLFNARQHSRT
jgi:hypothetical protein